MLILEAPNLLARVLGVGAHRRGDDALDVVGEVGARVGCRSGVSAVLRWCRAMSQRCRMMSLSVNLESTC